MAYFAKLGTENKILTVVSVHNDIATTEQAGVDFLNNLYNSRDVWKQTSYNTKGGVHYGQDGQQDDGYPLRKNYAGIDFTYDESRDAFIPPKPYASWILNETTCLWEAPSAIPDDGKRYNWNETTKSWDEII